MLDIYVVDSSIHWISKIKFNLRLYEEGTDSISHGYIITDISGKF